MRNGDFLKDNPSTKVKDLIEGMLKTKRVGLIAGDPGSGKTFFTLGVAYHIAYGADFLNRKTTKGAVLIIDSDNPKRVLQDRIKKIKRAIESNGYSDRAEVDIQHYSYFLLNDKRTWFEVEKVIKDIKPVLITFDHLMAFHTLNENNSRDMEKVANHFIELSNICGSTILVVHHFNKNTTGNFLKRLRGSIQIYARSEFAFEVRALSHNAGRLESFGVIPQPRKEKTVSPFRVVLEEDDKYIKLKYGGEYQPIEDPILDIIAHRIAHVFIKDKKMYTVEEVKNILAGMASDKQTREALRTLEEKEVVSVKRTGKAHKYEYAPKTDFCLWCQRTLKSY
jgi:hypothetical protein